MKVFRMWKDFESETMSNQDLLNFALGLWQEGLIKVTSCWDSNEGRQITRYEIMIAKDE